MRPLAGLIRGRDNMPTTSKQKKLINTTFDNLRAAVPDRGWGSDPFEKLYQHELKDEREHRRFKPDGLPADGLAVKDAAKLFTCRHILEPRQKGEMPPVEFMLDWRLVVFYGAAIWSNYKEQINAAVSDEAMAEFLALDYAELMKPRE